MNCTKASASVLIAIGVGTGTVMAQPAQHGATIVQAVRTSEPLQIDGRLSEESWTHAPVADRFTQRDPDEGRPATERTEIRAL